jgi:hypothetical protein
MFNLVILKWKIPMMLQQDTLLFTAERTRSHTFLLCCGILASALFSIVNFTFSALSPGYDVARQSISDLELGPSGWVQSVNFVIAGILMSAFALGLRKELVSGPGAMSIPLLQLVIGFIMALLGIFTGYTIQAVLILILFSSIMTSFFIFSRRFNTDERWANWSVYTNITAIVLLVFFALYVRSQMHSGACAGIYQRGVLLTRVLWNLFFTVRLLAGIKLGPVLK